MRQISNTGRQGFDLGAKYLTNVLRIRARESVSIFSSRFLIVMALSSGGASLKAEVAGDGKRPLCLYNVNLELGYLTEASGFGAGRGAILGEGIPLGEGTNSSQAATLGLAKVAFNLDWRLPRGVAVQMTLRPDAVDARDPDTGSPAREVDNRSGRVVEAMPEIHFLDEYRLVIKRPAVETRLGIKSSTLENFRVTPELLGFGLRVRGPEKSFGGRIDVPGVFQLGESKTDDLVGIHLGVLSGRDDRHNGRVGTSARLGESPAKRDPYWGGNLGVGLSLMDSTRAGVEVALIEEHSGQIKVRDEWYAAGIRRQMSTQALSKILVAMEARQLRQVFRLEGTEISDVQLTSVGLTSALRRSGGDALLLGFWMGAGDLHPEGVLSKSYGSRAMQFEGGWQWEIEEQLELTALMSREWRRDGAEGGTSVGGFARGDRTQSTQSRFALRVQYKIGDQI